jgi:hypothetical protein
MRFGTDAAQRLILYLLPIPHETLKSLEKRMVLGSLFHVLLVDLLLKRFILEMILKDASNRDAS